jgi:lipopolysaccharide export system protein LptA
LQFTIERLRTAVLAAGVVLLVALGVFLAIARFRHPFNLRELPKRLGVDIQAEANGVTYSHSLGAHSQYKIHASKEVQLKQGIVQLHDVKIELYGEDGSRVDRIVGDEFEYDPKSGKAMAAGPVEITLMRPADAAGPPRRTPKATPDQVVGEKVKGKPLASAAETAAAGEIHVNTSGLSFDWNSGVTTTTQHVDFSMMQGAGSSTGATYDSQQGILVLDRAVELTTRRGNDTVGIHAQHAVFERDNLACSLNGATADYRGGRATANAADILFRADGSAVRLEVTNGFTLATAAGGHLAAPKGSLDFDEHNQPRHGHLDGGVRMDSSNGNRQIHGTSPAAELEFTKQGEISLAHMERGVEIRSDQRSQAAANSKTDSGVTSLRVSRTWRSPVADVAFHDAGHGKVEPASIHGTGGVVVTGETQRGQAAPVPSRLAADDLTGEFGPHATLTAMTGAGHAGIQDKTATGATETASGDRLEAHFDPHFSAHSVPGASGAASGGSKSGPGGEAQIQSAVLDGHVVLVEQRAAKPGVQPGPPMRATAGKAVYEGAGEWLHLTLSPRVEDGAMELAADKIDVSQESGDAFAHGDVKATWLDNGGSGNGQAGAGTAGGAGSISLGGQGPAHAIAQEAELHRAKDEATFRGHARLWQQANSIAGPVIVIDRKTKTLVAQSSDRAEPVRVVLLSAGGLEPGSTSGKDVGGKSNGPSVIRVRGGELDYSDIDRKAVMVGGAMGTVVAETASAASVSSRVELYLVPAGKSAGKDTGQGQVDRMTAAGQVVVTSQGRRGTGEQLTYESKTGEYVLTGTAATPPRITDPVRGNVTGEALIFHSRDDSVSIEGGGRETRTETTVRQSAGSKEPRR